MSSAAQRLATEEQRTAVAAANAASAQTRAERATLSLAQANARADASFAKTTEAIRQQSAAIQTILAEAEAAHARLPSQANA